jgi:hypothetical protein
LEQLNSQRSFEFFSQRSFEFFTRSEKQNARRVAWVEQSFTNAAPSHAKPESSRVGDCVFRLPLYCGE